MKRLAFITACLALSCMACEKSPPSKEVGTTQVSTPTYKQTAAVAVFEISAVSLEATGVYVLHTMDAAVLTAKPEVRVASVKQLSGSMAKITNSNDPPTVRRLCKRQLHGNDVLARVTSSRAYHRGWC